MKLIELLKLIPKGLKNPELVIEGFLNNIKLENGTLPDDQVEEIAKRRLLCAGCPFMSENAKEMGFQTKRTDPFCTLCSCPIKSKTASLDSTCGAESYNKSHPDKPAIEVKWFAYGNKNQQIEPDRNSTETGE